MDAIPLDTLGFALAMLIAIAGFFSIAETAMMAVNRYRLRHRAHRGERGAKLALTLLGKTDTLLGVILLGNTLVAAGAATLTAVITKRLFGEGEIALAAGNRWFRLPAVCKLRGHPQEYRFATAYLHFLGEPVMPRKPPGPTGSQCRCGAVKITDDKGG